MCPGAESRRRLASIRWLSSHSMGLARPACTGATLSSKTFWLPRPSSGLWSLAGFQKSKSRLGIR